MPEKFECGAKFKKVWKWEHKCFGCGSIHYAKSAKGGKIVTTLKDRTFAMRIRQMETLMFSFDQRKLINLDFMLYKVFTRMGLPE